MLAVIFFHCLKKSRISIIFVIVVFFPFNLARYPHLHLLFGPFHSLKVFWRNESRCWLWSISDLIVVSIRAGHEVIGWLHSLHDSHFFFLCVFSLSFKFIFFFSSLLMAILRAVYLIRLIFFISEPNLLLFYFDLHFAFFWFCII